MDAGIRRQEILDRLAATRRPLAATRLGAQLGVSRQVIVGDVATPFENFTRFSGLDVFR